MSSLYPLRFKPLLRETLWGGDTLRARFGKRASRGAAIGESWEICGMPGASSVVANGFLKDNTLEEIADIYMDELVGDAVYQRYSNEFPLLVKLIDATDRLSIQVHPNDQLAEERHHAWGKTEMWYIIDASPGAVIYTGFRRQSSREEYLEHLAAGRVADLINETPVTAGDVFYIPAGLVHAIGAGVVLAEIQQTSDVTYRIYDWDRTGSDGKPRELHTALALDAIDFSMVGNHLVKREPQLNSTVLLAEGPYFRTNMIMFDRPIIKDYSLTDSFIIYLCTESMAVIELNGQSEEIEAGETLLIPASAESVAIIPRGTARLLEIFIP